MPEILSQQEIDSLLSGLPADPLPAAAEEQEGGKPQKEAIAFDFRLPHRLSKNQLRTMQAVHETFGQNFASYLLSRLQTTVSITVTAVDQILYSDFVLSVASPSCLYIFRVAESDALAMMEFDPLLVLAMVSRLLGGSAEAEKKGRLITRIEQSIIKSIAQRAMTELQRAWKVIADLSFKLERYESEADFARIAPPSEIVLVVSLEVAVGDQKYLMSLCFQTFALEDVLAKLNVQRFSGFPGLQKGGEWMKTISTNLQKTAVPCVGLLGTTTVTMRQLLGLEAGDILRTSIPDNAEVQMLVGGKARLLGHAGISNGRLAVKVTRSTEEHFEGEY